MRGRRTLVLPLAFAVALGAAGCGSGGRDDGDVGGLKRLGRVTVTGTGYAFRVPGFWRDRKDDLPATPAAAVRRGDAVRDVIWSVPRNSGASFLTNIATTYDPLPAQGIAGPQTVDALAAATRREFARSGGTVSPISATTLDGAPARAFAVRSRTNGADLEQRQILAVRRGRLYTLASTAAASEAADGAEAIRAARATWRWR